MTPRANRFKLNSQDNLIINNHAHGDVLNVIEAAALLRIHPVTLRRRAVTWGVPHKRLGVEWRFSRKRLIEWLQEDKEVAA